MSLDSPTPGYQLPELWKTIGQEVLGNPVDENIGSQRPAMASLLNNERLEKLKILRPRLLTINAESPESSPDLVQVERLYTANLVPDEAFLAYEQGDHRVFTRAVDRGGMLNRFQPSVEELKRYPKGYESVRTQLIKDMTGEPDRPGLYRMVGMFDDQDVLRASLSYRLPPRKITDSAQITDTSLSEIDMYRTYLEESLLNPRLLKGRPPQMWYDAQWKIDRMERQFLDMFEIDTFNVEQGWGGAGYLVLQSALEEIKREWGEIPEAVFCYRFHGLRLPHADTETHQRELVGPNRKSRIFLENLGFTEMAERFVRNDVVVREMSDGKCHIYHPQWSYLYNGRNRLQRQLRDCLEEMGLGTEQK